MRSPAIRTRPFSMDSPDLAADQDRESFQATLRLGTLGGRIRPVKRCPNALRVRLVTLRSHGSGHMPRTTPLPGKLSRVGTRSELPQTSIREVARRAGVSVGTVSNVLNRPDLVAEATRDRVRAAIEESDSSGTSPRVHSAGPRPHRGRVRRPAAPAFGIVVEDLTNPYASDVARGAEAALNAAGHDALWLSSDHSSAKERRSLELLEEQRAAGVLIIPVGLNPGDISQLRAAGMSVVLIDRDSSQACSARVDHVAGGRSPPRTCSASAASGSSS